jgi:hypothetical protein
MRSSQTVPFAKYNQNDQVKECGQQKRERERERESERYPCYRPWRLLQLQEVKASTLLRQRANRWQHGCQPYALAALYSQVSLLRFLVLISVGVDPREHRVARRIRQIRKNPPHRDVIPRPSSL